MVMGFRAQAINASSEQAKLHPELNHQAKIVKSEGLPRSHKACRILFTADIFRHKDSADARIGEALCPSQDLLPKCMMIGALKIPKLGLDDDLLDQFPHRALLAVQKPLHCGWFEAGARPLNRRIAKLALACRLVQVT